MDDRSISLKPQHDADDESVKNNDVQADEFENFEEFEEADSGQSEMSADDEFQIFEKTAECSDHNVQAAKTNVECNTAGFIVENNDLQEDEFENFKEFIEAGSGQSEMSADDEDFQIYEKTAECSDHSVQVAKSNIEDAELICNTGVDYLPDPLRYSDSSSCDLNHNLSTGMREMGISNDSIDCQVSEGQIEVELQGPHMNFFFNDSIDKQDSSYQTDEMISISPIRLHVLEDEIRSKKMGQQKNKMEEVNKGKYERHQTVKKVKDSLTDTEDEQESISDNDDKKDKDYIVDEEDSEDEADVADEEHDEDKENDKNGCEISDKNEKNDKVTNKVNEKNKVNDESCSSGNVHTQFVPTSDEGGKWYKKSNFCFFCLTLQNRIDRHLINRHGNEKEVQAASALPPGSKERREKLKFLRLKGNEVFNKSKSLNPAGKLICPRITSAKKTTASTATNPDNNNIPSNDIVSNTAASSSKVQKPERIICDVCRGYYSFKNLHNHYREMHGGQTSNTRSVKMASRREMAQCHKRASKKVIEDILPKLRADPCANAAKYDLLCILYANKYAEKYDNPDQEAYVRGHIRLLGKLLLGIRQFDPSLTDLIMAFRPKYWETMKKAILLISGYNSGTKRFSIPYNAETLPIIIRKCFRILKNEFTKDEDNEKLEFLTNFSYIFEDEVEASITAKAVLSRKEVNRHKNRDELPEIKDIIALQEYLQRERDSCIQALVQEGPVYSSWYRLTEIVPLLIQIFNRRRSGEISRTSLLDYKHAKVANHESEYFKELCNKDQLQRTKYKRIDIQGKRIDGKGCLYVSEENDVAIKLLVENREVFNVSNKNPYLFALPGSENRHIDITVTMPKYTKKCAENYKAFDAKSIRGTKLRKQLATYNMSINNDNNIRLITNHLGHSEQIHKSVYRRTIDKQDAQITEILESANKNKNSCDETKARHKSKNIKRKAPVTSDSSENDEIEVSAPKKTKGTIRRRSWNMEEVDAFKQGFEKFIRQRKYPSANEIREVVQNYPALSKRTESVIRTRFSNIFKAASEKDADT